jgi:hypothetical protein
MACRLLAVEPGLRPSAVGCLTGLTPGRPVTYADVGAQSGAALEEPYEVADWIAATEPASEAPDILLEQQLNLQHALGLLILNYRTVSLPTLASCWCCTGAPF